MNQDPIFRDALAIDCADEVARICERLREAVTGRLKRRGVVVALSGGVDSSVSAALAARALTPARVMALFLPERESRSQSRELALEVARQLGIAVIEEDITDTLETIGCYRVRDLAIRRSFPDYGLGWKSKLTIAGGGRGFHFFRLVVQAPDGTLHSRRVEHRQYLEIVAAQNYKQRCRKMVEYFHADRLHYGVIGTPNRLEYLQGFFVKGGDGAADVKPIAHLYKTQVYALARHLGLPQAVCDAAPTTDTYSLSQTQDEFYFALPHREMDLALWSHEHGVPPARLAAAIGLDEAQAEGVYRDIESKRETTKYLHLRPLLLSADAQLHRD